MGYTPVQTASWTLAGGRTKGERMNSSPFHRVTTNVPVCLQLSACSMHGHAVHMRHMIVRSFRHRGLRQLYENNSSRLLKQDLVERVRGILAALALAETMEGFIREAAPGWRVHRLSGEPRNEWSVSVSGNWRITFEELDGAITRVNLEDYH